MLQSPIRLIIGLGNPGKEYQYTRHNAGFLVVDELAKRHNGSWKLKGKSEVCTIRLYDQTIQLIKPQTYMNTSGTILPEYVKQGILPEQIIVIHDELELPFGSIVVKQGGGHRGHNGIRSIMNTIGPDFYRVRFGISRPATKEEVGEYVLASFNQPRNDLIAAIEKAADKVESLMQ